VARQVDPEASGFPDKVRGRGEVLLVGEAGREDLAGTQGEMPPEKVFRGGAPAEVSVAEEQKVGVRGKGGEKDVCPPALLRPAAEEARQAPDEGGSHPGIFLSCGAGEAFLSECGSTAIVCLPEGDGGRRNPLSSSLSVEGILRPFCLKIKTEGGEEARLPLARKGPSAKDDTGARRASFNRP